MGETNINGTDRIITFLRQEMLTPFCVQWSGFSRLCDKLGDQQVLKLYADKLSGRGYKASEIKQAINKSIMGGNEHPKPQAFADLVQGRDRNSNQNGYRNLTRAEKHAVGQMLGRMNGADQMVNRAAEMHRQLGTSFKGPNVRAQLDRQIEKVAEQLLGRPLSKG